MADENDMISKMKRKYTDMQEGLKRDIRPQISRAMGYNPEADMYRDPHAFEYKEYPKWVKKGDQSVIVQNREEENQLLGKKHEPAKKATVDIAQLVSEPTEVRIKRKYTKKAKPADLPPNLD